MKRSAKLGLAVILVAIGGALAFVGATPQAYQTVSALANDPADWEGRLVEVKATVVPGSLNATAEDTPLAFTVRDDRMSLPVRWDAERPIPPHEDGGTIEGRTIVVKGTVVQGDDGTWFLLAEDMQVGCASKYEPA